MKRGAPLQRGTAGLSRSGGGLSRSGGMPSRQKRIPPRSRSRPREGVTDEVAQEVIRRSGGICERCRVRPGTELHHRVTRARGGPHDAFNLAHLCGECHHVWAHGENEYPWLVPGYFIRGVYHGIDEAYRAQYPPRPLEP